MVKIFIHISYLRDHDGGYYEPIPQFLVEYLTSLRARILKKSPFVPVEVK